MAATAMAQPRDTRQQVFDPAFRTLRVEREGQPLASPVIALDVPADRIVISFDELTDERSELRYELIHCDASWRPSQILEQEYLEGFNQADVDDYAFSRATLVHYVNYRITIPNADMRPLISGNYMLRVYRNDDPDTTLLQARFCVTEQSMAVGATVTGVTDIDYNDAHQQLTVEVDTRGSDISNPYTDLRLVIKQNGRDDNAARLTSPLRVTGTTAVFDHQAPLIFNAGNEYRRFETVSTSFLPMNVESIYRPMYEGETYMFDLRADRPRATERYNYDSTQKGRYVVREYNSARSDEEADYCLVRFTLEAPEQQGDVYIEGDLTGRLFSPASRMTYDAARGLYEATLLLKQGSYNYQYLTVSPDGKELLTAPIEGDKYETDNEYTIYVYYRPRLGRYDRLAAFATVGAQK